MSIWRTTKRDQKNFYSDRFNYYQRSKIFIRLYLLAKQFFWFNVKTKDYME